MQKIINQSVRLITFLCILLFPMFCKADEPYVNGRVSFGLGYSGSNVHVVEGTDVYDFPIVSRERAHGVNLYFDVMRQESFGKRSKGFFNVGGVLEYRSVFFSKGTVHSVDNGRAKIEIGGWFHKKVALFASVGAGFSVVFGKNFVNEGMYIQAAAGRANIGLGLLYKLSPRWLLMLQGEYVMLFPVPVGWNTSLSVAWLFGKGLPARKKRQRPEQRDALDGAVSLR